MLERLFETVGSLGGPWAYLAVGALAAGESSIGVGLVVPGETGMLVGGFIVSQGNAEFGLMWMVAVLGAIAGDSIGYEIGRHFGPRIRRTRVGRAMGEERWEAAESYLARRGGKAVFLGRFVAVVRSVVPAMAGITRMPYGKFLRWNALGAMVWATIYVSLGYVAGRSYERVAEAAEGAGYVLLALLVVLVLVVVAARWVAHHPEKVQVWGDRLAARRPTRFLVRRFQPGHAFGLSLTAGLLALIFASWALVTVASDVEARSDIVDVDEPVVRWLAEQRADWLTDLSDVVTDLGSMAVLAPLVLVAAAGWFVRTRRWGVAVFLAVAVVGAVVATDVLKNLLERPRPPDRFAAAEAGGWAFPSGHTTQATVVYGALAYLHGSVLRLWSARVAVWAAALLVTLTVGFTRAYLGVHWLSDVLGGYALGVVWLTIVITAFGAGTRLHRQRARVSSRAA